MTRALARAYRAGMHDATQTYTPNDNPRTRKPKAPAIPSPLSLDEPDSARYIGYSRSWLRQQRMRDQGPPYIKVNRTIRYRVSDLDAWLAQHRVEPRDERQA